LSQKPPKALDDWAGGTWLPSGTGLIKADDCESERKSRRRIVGVTRFGMREGAGCRFNWGETCKNKREVDPVGLAHFCHRERADAATWHQPLFQK